MITAMMSVMLALGSTVGGSPCLHARESGECRVCEEENSEVQLQIERLHSCEGWMARCRAARALRRYGWKSHPEAADALAEALRHDDCGLVRQEAAESLAKLRPCLPFVHETVARAAKCDPCLLARAWAKKALKSIGKSCVAECSICGPGETVIGEDQFDEVIPVVPGASPLPIDSSVDPLPPAILEVPVGPAARSPFTPGSGSRPPLPSPTLPPARLESPDLLPPGDSVPP